METRNILDTLGNVIGSLELDSGLSEAIWTEKLNEYSQTVTNSLRTIVATQNITASSTTTTSSSSAAVISGMERNLTAGKYLATFTGNIYTAGASATGEFGIYLNGSLIANTRRDIFCNLTLLGGLVTVSLNAIGVGTTTGTELTVNENDLVDVRFRSTNGGTIGFKERSLTLIKVA